MLAHMRLIAEIDVLEDVALQRRMVRASAALFVAGAVACALLAAAFGEGLGDVCWWLALAAGSLAALPVHELVHGAAFKLLVPGCRVTFGWQGAFLYTNAHGAVMARGVAVPVLLAPAVLVTAALAAIALTCGFPALAALLCGVHLSGCTGDLLMVREVLREPACTHVRDTDCGIDLLGE